MNSVDIEIEIKMKKNFIIHTESDTCAPCDRLGKLPASAVSKRNSRCIEKTLNVVDESFREPLKTIS